MFNLLLISIVIAPVLLGMRAASGRRGRRRLLPLLVLVLGYDLFYFVMLYYLRIRWVGWGGGPG